VTRTLRRPWVLGALVAEAVLAVIDVLSGDAFLVRSLYLLPVLVVAVRADVRSVVVVGVVAVCLAAMSLAWGQAFDEEYLRPLATVAAGSVVAVWAARERQAAERERGQMRLLAEAAQITDGARDIDDALRRLAALLVPDFADTAWIDVVTPGGDVRRLAVRVDGPHAAELERWLADRPRTSPATLAPARRVLEGEGPQQTVLDAARIEAIAADAEDRRHLLLSGMRMTMAVPLGVGPRPLGVLTLAVGRSGRRFRADDLAFAELLAGRAALTLHNAQLLVRLTATQERLDGILGALAEAVTVHDAEGRVVYANPAAAALLGADRADAVLAAEPGRLLQQFELTDADGAPLPPDRLPGRRVVLGDTPEPLLMRVVVRATGEVRWYVAKATPLRDAETGGTLAVNIVEDVTEEHEAALRQRFLTEAGEALAASLDYEETLQRVARLAVSRLADWCTIELPDERGILQHVGLAHVDPAMEAEGREVRSRYPPDPDTPGGSYQVLRDGRSLLYAEVPDEALVAGAQDAEHLERARRLDIGTVMIVPMRTGGRTLGVMTFVRGRGRRYDEDDVRFAEDLAARAATAVENARLYTERSAVAHTLQASLLPERLPELPGWRAAADYRAGQAGTEVGGDFYDAFPVEGGSMIILGDVTGKGVTAAALTSLVRHTAKTGADFDPRPSAVLALVNRALRRQPRVAPVTMLCALLGDGEVTLAAGGHPLPLLKRAGEPARKVGETGLLLGAVEDYDAAVDVGVPVVPGDTLVLFTDGVTDTPGEPGRYGDVRLRAAVEAAPADPAALVERLTAVLDEFQRGRIADDRAILALQYTGTREPDLTSPSRSAGYARRAR
jgi:GAF domain-containing protein